MHDNLKTIADICFLLGINVDLRKIWEELACHGYRSSSRSFSEDSRSLAILSLASSETFL